MIKKSILVASLGALLMACDDGSPYLKHDLSYEKAGDCSALKPGISVDANTIGERYVVEKCLGADFKGEYEAQHHGDTVEIKLKSSGAANTGYRITLDINTRPSYRFITINGETFGVSVNRQ